jgi:diguanylate cyclase (GGDEF)-like protein
VLIAEDEQVTRRLLESMLRRWGYEVVGCSDGRQAWDVLREPDSPRLAILDWMMPGIDGPEICRRLREHRREDYVYVILLTSKDGAHDIVAGLDAGADDYVGKPFNPPELKVRLRAGRRIIELQQELVAAQEALRDQATHDSLTGLWNRAAILDLLHAETARAARQGGPLGIIMADIDHFKRVNDIYGHAAGDAVLRETARRLAASVRPYDSAARYGGEEFLCVLPRCDARQAASVAERIRRAIAGEAIEVPKAKLGITISLGVAAGGGNEGGEALIRAADAALYRAKNAGRNRVEVAAEAGQAPDSQPRDTEAALTPDRAR